MSNKELALFKEQLNRYNSTFNHFYTPDRDILVDDNKRQEFFDLVERSCKEDYDYVAEHYKIDVEHRKKHYDVIYD